MATWAGLSLFVTVAMISLQPFVDGEDVSDDLVRLPGAVTRPCISRQDMPHIRSSCQPKTSRLPLAQHSDTGSEIRWAVEQCLTSGLTGRRVEPVLACALGGQALLSKPDTFPIVGVGVPMGLVLHDGDRQERVDAGLGRLLRDDVRVHDPRRLAQVRADEPHRGDDEEGAAHDSLVVVLVAFSEIAFRHSALQCYGCCVEAVVEAAVVGRAQFRVVTALRAADAVRVPGLIFLDGMIGSDVRAAAVALDEKCGEGVVTLLRQKRGYLARELE